MGNCINGFYEIDIGLNSAPAESTEPPDGRVAYSAFDVPLMSADLGETILEVQDLRTVFATKDGIVKAVDGVAVPVGAGEWLGIVGESGCGKSVTAMSIMGLQRPGKIVGGKVLFKGRDLTKASETEMREIRGQ